MRKILILALFALFSLEARKPYKAGIDVSGTTAIVHATNLVNLKRDLSTQAIQELIPIYTPVSAVTFGINLRGLKSIASFAANSTTLNVIIPNAGITTSFTGSTRDESIALYKDYLQQGSGLHKLLKAYARYSPIDPVAGNPNSLMSQLAVSDYNLAKLSPLSGCDCGWSAQPVVHQFKLGAEYQRGFSGGYDTGVAVLPIRYSYSPNGESAFIVDAPFYFIGNGGAYSAYGSLGLGFRYPLTHNWSLTPVVRAGGGGSLDLTVSGAFFTAGLLSNYNLKLNQFVFSLTNYADYSTSTNLWLTGLNFNYHLQSWVFKNGFSITSCDAYCLLNRPINFSVNFVDTYFSKSHRLFNRHYDEVGASIIINYLNPCLEYDALILGASYLFGNRYRGYTLKLDYQF